MKLNSDFMRFARQDAELFRMRVTRSRKISISAGMPREYSSFC